jgi:hypothetical protein
MASTIYLSVLSHTFIIPPYPLNIQFSMMREVEFSTENNVQKLLPFVQPIRHHYQEYFFKDICFN